MNKKELTIVVLLFAALFGWGIINRKSFIPPVPPPVTEEEAVESTMDTPAETMQSDAAISAPEENVEPAPEPEVVAPAPAHTLPEKREYIENDVLRLTVSSWGGTIVESQLKDYPETNEDDSGPVVLDFSEYPALAINGIPGLSTKEDFSVVATGDKRAVKISRSVSSSLVFERSVELADGYSVKVTDSFRNISNQPVDVAEYKLGVGIMRKVKTKSTARRGFVYLGADTMSAESGKDIVYWEKKGDPASKETYNLLERFQPPYRQGGCAMFKPKLTEQLPKTIEIEVDDLTDWVAVKNKFFVQIMAGPIDENAASGYCLNVAREVPENEVPEDPRTWLKNPVLETVSADMVFDGKELKPDEVLTRELNYFVGPKKYSDLKTLGRHQDKIMFRAWKGWGWFRSLCTLLLWTLNAIYSIIPNYGVAIILLTIIVRLVFWPIMQKSTDSMKKMQKLQPLIQEIKDKYKDNPQKQQQATMALYKEHKVNPMASCLPMLVQMPIFIALFVMLRSAVELRYADFLWITDLSEPERLFEGTAFFNAIPFVPCLNILPLVMTVTMIWQQKLTPSSGDAQQKQMMVMMPAMMLIMFYNMASALVLYWTTSQVLAIVQLLLKKDKGEAATA